MDKQELAQLMEKNHWSIHDIASMTMCSKWAVYKYLDGSRSLSPLAVKVLREAADEPKQG